MQGQHSPAAAVADPAVDAPRSANLDSRRDQGSAAVSRAPENPRNVATANYASSAGNGELILVVDDEPCVRLVASQILTRAGYRVVTAENGVEGIALYRVHHESIALVISDMIMPVMDGPTMVEALLELDPTLRVMVASGSNTEGDRAKFTVHGVKHFLPKPYTSIELIATVKTVLATAPSGVGNRRVESRAR